MSAGCNNLIKIGAAPITSVDDVLHELGLQDAGAQIELPLAQTREESTLIALLAEGTRDGDELHQKSGLPAAAFNQTMTMMEIEGKIKALGSNQWTLKR